MHEAFPVVSSVLGQLAMFLALNFGVAGLFSSHTPTGTEMSIGAFLILYYFGVAGLRLREKGVYTLYELMWACNASLVISGVGLLVGRPHFAAAILCTVGIDQVFWYVDLLGKACFNYCPVGAASYIFWPQTGFWERLTALHHVWFAPLLLYLLRGHFGPAHFLLSCAYSVLLPLYCRFFSPPTVKHRKSDGEVESVYLNINMAFGLWKDMPGFLHLVDGKNFWLYLPFASALCIVLNTPAYFLFRVIVSVMR